MQRLRRNPDLHCVAFGGLPGRHLQRLWEGHLPTSRSASDINLPRGRLFAPASSTGRQEDELMAIATRMVHRPGVSHIQPDFEAVRVPEVLRLDGDRVHFPSDIDTQIDPPLVPGQMHIGVRFPAIERHEVRDQVAFVPIPQHAIDLGWLPPVETGKGEIEVAVLRYPMRHGGR